MEAKYTFQVFIVKALTLQKQQNTSPDFALVKLFSRLCLHFDALPGCMKSEPCLHEYQGEELTATKKEEQSKKQPIFTDNIERK